MNNDMNRREFMKATAIAGVGAAVAPNLLFAKSRGVKSKIKLGLIGVGLRGEWHLMKCAEKR